jgi:N-methylhydantoinase B
MLKEDPLGTREPGDSLITNDPWIGTGHLSDLTIVTPSFRHDRLVAFVGNIAHSPDMGGWAFLGHRARCMRRGCRSRL